MIKTRSYIVLSIMLVLVIALAGMGSPAQAEDEPPLPVPHQPHNAIIGPLTQHGEGAVGESAYKNAKGPICTTAYTNDANVNTDCEGANWPHNETSIDVNPTNPLNIIGSANDYQLKLSQGGTINETALSRAHVTFDGGHTWTTYPIAYKGYVSTGDPAVAFDDSGTAYLATLGFLWSQGLACCTNPDILVSHSNDGGVTWSKPSRVVSGSGTFGSVGLLNDKEFIAAWGDGNAIVTWTEYNLGLHGSYLSSPIFASVTHDGGETWSKPVEISGSADFCVGAQGGNACDQDQASVPVMGAGGHLYVTFINYSNDPDGRDQYIVVEVDPATGQRIAGPYRVGLVYDGFTDYPRSIFGDVTYQDSQFRSWAVGNIAADPVTAGHIAVIWSDMRNSVLPAAPYSLDAVTNSDVIVSQSFDGGATWSDPMAIAMPNDQFQPWGAYDANGLLRIGYFDRSYDPDNHKYGYTLATETAWGALTFGTAQLTTVLSEPTRDDRWFSGGVPDYATTFLGDYSGIAAVPGGGVVALWTDMRLQACLGTRCGWSEDAFFAFSP